MPSEQLQALVEMLRSRPAPTEASIEEQRADFEQMASPFPVAADVVTEPVDAAGVPAE